MDALEWGATMALILTRAVGDITRLELPDGTTIDVVLLSAGGGRARLAFEAPRKVRIYRPDAHKPRPKVRLETS